MGNRLKGKVAVITGSGQGIGKAIAIAMAKEGATVVTNDYQPGTAESVAKEIRDMGEQAVAFFGDISEVAIAQKLIQVTVDNFSRVDILINNAGSFAHGMVWDLTEEDWDRVVNSHLKGSFNCCRHVCGLMREQRWGRIINTASIAWLGMLDHCNYCAAKAGIVGLTRALALEMGRYGVTCNAYCPSAGTGPHGRAEPYFKKSYELGIWTKEMYERAMNPPPPEAMPPFIIYLCIEEAANINGQVFDVRGGRIGIYSVPAVKESIIKEEGLLTVEELKEAVPKVLLKGYVNPAPVKLPR